MPCPDHARGGGGIRVPCPGPGWGDVGLPYQGCHVSGKCQGKMKFSPGQGKVREF